MFIFEVRFDQFRQALKHKKMKSTIRIDVDHDNQPVIRIEYFPSDDVRDTLVKKFLEAFGGGCYARFFFRQSNDPQPINTTAYVRPINAFDLPKEQEFFNEQAEAHRKLQEQQWKDAQISEEVTSTAEKLTSTTTSNAQSFSATVNNAKKKKNDIRKN